MKKKLSKGQTLIETLAALAIISMVMTAIGVSVITALSTAKYNQNETLATKYAQQGAEVVRQIRDGNYTKFSTYIGTNYCLAKDASSLTQGCTTPNIDNTFIRAVQVQQSGCATNVAKVIVTVSFADGKCAVGTYCHSQINTSCLSTINPVAAP